MNYLAHLFLGQSKSEWLVGNFIADQVKGKQINDFSPEVQEGIRMHRAIDEYTDNHPKVLERKRQLYANYHKYAAVIIDVFFDHVLAKNWENYSPLSLSAFSSSCYALLEAQQEILPEQSKTILFYMKRDDWLTNYATIEGMGKALTGLSRRARFDSKMDTSVDELAHNYEVYKTSFMAFFPELYKFIQQNYSI